MKQEEMEKLFEKHDDEFLEFDKVENKRSKRPDIHAFLLLDELQPQERDMVSFASHDEIGLDIDLSKVCKKITEEQVIDLVRCGIRIDNDAFVMFV